jgi:dUTP pyrophosphatase
MNVKKLSDTAKIPTKGSSSAAGYDLYSIESHTLQPGERKAFRTGITLAIPEGLYGRVAPRSGLSVKHGIDVLAGVIDSDYRGELLVALINLGQEPITLPLVKDGKETAIAQIIFETYTNHSFTETNNLDETQRGSGGFGSTDVNQSTSSSTPKSLEELLKIKEAQFQVGQKYSEAIKERDNKIFNK